MMFFDRHDDDIRDNVQVLIPTSEPPRSARLQWKANLAQVHVEVKLSVCSSLSSF